MPRTTTTSKKENNHQSTEGFHQVISIDQQQQQQEPSTAIDIDEANRQTFANMVKRANDIMADVITKLRTADQATLELRNAQELMYNMEMMVSRHRYTMPEAGEEYQQLDDRFVVLVTINDLKVQGRWPFDSEGRPYQLSPLQRQVLWF